MRLITKLAAVLTAIAAIVAAPSWAGVKVGDAAPAFDLPGTDGKQHKLSELTDQGWVVLAWFPKAYTSGCTIECKSLAENGHLLRKFNVKYYMASVDPLADNIGFAEKEGADFPLLSDVSKSVAAAYGVLSPRGFAKRHTFYINSEGTIVAIDQAVKPATSAEDMAAMLAELGAPPAVATPAPPTLIQSDQTPAASSE